MTRLEFLKRYADYREAIAFLAGSGTTVAQRREAIDRRDTFERDMRAGVFTEGILAEPAECTGDCQDNRCPVHGFRQRCLICGDPAMAGSDYCSVPCSIDAEKNR